ncbi:hypothetical protein P5V15_011628 [Pogonomyrmex californicus]
MSLLAIVLLCRFFEADWEARAQGVAAAALQHTRNILTYTSRYTRNMPALRIEEVGHYWRAIWCTASPIGRDIATNQSRRMSHFCATLSKRTTSARCRR